MAKLDKKENKEIKESTGLNSLAIKLIAYVITAVGIILTVDGPSKFEYVNYLQWITYPVFAYFIAVGFDETSSKLRYFIRLLVFSIIAEIPYDFLKTGSVFSMDFQNGMLTLCLGFIALVVLTFLYNKTKNTVICGIATYFVGYGLYWITRTFNFECSSFGIMFVIVFYISRHCKYTKLLQIALVAFLIFIVYSENSLTFIIGNIQYSMPYKAFSLFSLFIIWLYNGKHGPNKLWITISEYCFYPAILGILAILQLV